MFKQLKSKNEGFTIIEVLIVLAIAGLIMVIVFLAVPSLQRNNRNTQRNNDAARIAGAVNECLTNNNGNLTNCDTTAELANYITVGNNQQLITVVNTGNGTTDQAALRTSARCNNNAPDTNNASARSFAVGYQVETSGSPVNRCVGS